MHRALARTTRLANPRRSIARSPSQSITRTLNTDVAVADYLPDPPTLSAVNRERRLKEIAEEEAKRPAHAVVSVFDLLSIGIGPSSSHTVGPCRASKIFATELDDSGLLEQVSTLKCTLYGSLAATGKGHMSVPALLAGFEGADVETVDTDRIIPRYEEICATKTMVLLGKHSIDWDISRDLTWLWDQTLPFHPNGMLFSCYDAAGDLLATETLYSVGGGFVLRQGAVTNQENAFCPSDARSSSRL